MKLSDQLTNTAMQIILHAGDARRYSEEAFTKALDGDFISSEKLIQKSDELILKAHQSQTEVIQNSASGIEYKISLLFIHSQDTLMTIISEVNITKRLIEILKIIR